MTFHKRARISFESVDVCISFESVEVWGMSAVFADGREEVCWYWQRCEPDEQTSEPPRGPFRSRTDAINDWESRK